MPKRTPLAAEDAERLARERYDGEITTVVGLTPVKGGFFVEINDPRRSIGGWVVIDDQGEFEIFPSAMTYEDAIKEFEKTALLPTQGTQEI